MLKQRSMKQKLIDTNNISRSKKKKQKNMQQKYTAFLHLKGSLTQLLEYLWMFR